MANLIKSKGLYNFYRGEKTVKLKGNAVMDSTYGTPKYKNSNMWHLELAMILAGSVVVGALVVCYIYVFRHLCCPPPRHRRRRQGKPTEQLTPAGAARATMRHESLPMTNLNSQPTEIEKL